MAVALTRRMPVQKFKPTSGRAVGFLSVLVILLAAGDLIVAEHDLFALRVSLGLGVVALVVWMSMLRPRAVAYPDTLVLHNMVSDTTLPMAKIEAVLVRHTLNVWIGQERYVCVGIGRSSRSMSKRRESRAMTLFAVDQSEERMGQGQSAKIGAGTEYANFVETRIEGLAHQARRDRLDAPPASRTWAVPELVALGVLVVAFVVSLLV